MLKLLDGNYPNDIEETLYEYFEKDYAVLKMKESSWNHERNQILIDEGQKLIYTFNPEDSLLSLYPGHSVIILDDT